MNPEQSTRSPLREALEATGCSLDDVTVLSSQNDPFRMDTPAHHLEGEWLAMMFQELGITKKIHNRGIHYALLGKIKPDGKPYTSSDENWKWLQQGPIDAARWLGYIPWEQMIDERNLPPVIKTWFEWKPKGGIDQDLVPMPDIKLEIKPAPVLNQMFGEQPFHLVIFGEKSSLSPILSSISEGFHADLYLPTGEMSDIMLYQMAKSGEADPRKMIVFCISDCDPAGWQMPISISRKLQAFKVTHFSDLDFEVRRVLLMPWQVKKDLRHLQLPGSPLKEEEKRKDKWKLLMGVEQIEVDALVTLHPEVLRELVVEAIQSFYDETLDKRVAEAKKEWLADAQELIDEHVDRDALKEANDRLDALNEHVESEIEEINAKAEEILDEEEIELPEIEVPKAEDNSEEAPEPLIDSEWNFESQCKRLIQSKRYRIPEDSGKAPEIQKQCAYCGKEFWIKDDPDEEDQREICSVVCGIRASRERRQRQ